MARTPNTSPTPTPKVRAVTGTAEDTDAAWLWLQATLYPLKLQDPALYEETLRRTPALPILIRYRNLVRDALAGLAH